VGGKGKRGKTSKRRGNQGGRSESRKGFMIGGGRKGTLNGRKKCMHRNWL